MSAHVLLNRFFYGVISLPDVTSCNKLHSDLISEFWQYFLICHKKKSCVL